MKLLIQTSKVTKQQITNNNKLAVSLSKLLSVLYSLIMKILLQHSNGNVSEISGHIFQIATPYVSRFDKIAF